jgi:hypothetical protein
MVLHFLFSNMWRIKAFSVFREECPNPKILASIDLCSNKRTTTFYTSSACTMSILPRQDPTSLLDFFSLGEDDNFQIPTISLEEDFGVPFKEDLFPLQDLTTELGPLKYSSEYGPSIDIKPGRGSQRCSSLEAKKVTSTVPSLIHLQVSALRMAYGESKDNLKDSSSSIRQRSLSTKEDNEPTSTRAM